MFLKKTKYKNGRVFLSITEGYRVDGKNKHRTIQKVGYLDQLYDDYDDPIAHFTQVAKDMTVKANQESSFSFEIDMNSSIEQGKNLYNVGYGVLKKIYNELGLTSFFTLKNQAYNVEYNFNKIFQLLVFSRILYPASKRETFLNKERFFEPYHHFTLSDMYNSLDYFCLFKQEIEKWLWNYSKDIYHRDASTTYYDCTNYYFEIGFNDDDIIDEDGNLVEKGYRKRGPEKNKRPDPIIQMGLLMDSNGIPLSYDIFPGNESEKTSLRPLLRRTKSDYGIQKTIVVADRGLNTSDNIYFLAGKNDDTKCHMDGYVYGQSIRGADKEFKRWALEQVGFQVDIVKENDCEVKFIHKSRLYAKEIQIKKDNKRTVKVQVYQKQMVYYSSQYAKKQKKEREMMIAKAMDLISKPGKYTKATSYGAANYVKNIVYDKQTGEIKTDKQLSLNLEKIEEEAKYDGYYSIVTSEKKLSDHEIRKIYRGLIEIEDTFKVTKSNLETRPVYVWTKEHIESHFLTCFVALVLIRLLEKKLNNKYTVEQIITTLRNYNCIRLDKNIYQFLYKDEMIEDIEKVFNIDLSKKYKKREEIRKFLQY